MASLDRIPSSSFCSPSARFITLVTIAIIGTTIVIVMMSVPQVRNTVTFKKTQCTVLNKTLETAQLGSRSETRGILTVCLYLIHIDQYHHLKRLIPLSTVC